MNPVLNFFLRDKTIKSDPVLPRLPGKFEKKHQGTVNNISDQRIEDHHSVGSSGYVPKIAGNEFPEKNNKTVGYENLKLTVENNHTPKTNKADVQNEQKLPVGDKYPVAVYPLVSNTDHVPQHSKNEKPLADHKNSGDKNKFSGTNDQPDKIKPALNPNKQEFFEQVIAARQRKISAEGKPSVSYRNLSPTIKVTIGRIELKAINSSQPAQPNQSVSHKPKLALEDLLKSKKTAGS